MQHDPTCATCGAVVGPAPNGDLTPIHGHAAGCPAIALHRVLDWARSVHTDGPRCEDGDCWLCRDIALLSGLASLGTSETREGA